MRILFWCSRYWPRDGGVQILGGHLASALQGRGHELIVITQHDASDQAECTTIDGIPVFRLPFWQALDRRNSGGVHDLRREIRAIKVTFKPQIIHMYHMGPDAFFELQTRADFSAPLICSLHGIYPAGLFQPRALFYYLLRASRWVTAPSAAVVRHVRQCLPEVGPRSSVIYNALEFPTLVPAPLPYTPPRLLCLGRLVEEKGFDVALAAFPRIRAQYPTARLLMAGDGPDRAALEWQASTLGVADAVEFIGWVDPNGVPALINTTTMVLMPSRKEGLPLVSLQTAQMARPLIATRVGGLPEVIHDGETGILVDMDDTEGLARAALALLGDPDRAQRLGQAARLHVAQQFRWDRFVDAFDHLFTRVLAQEKVPVAPQ
jgi:glycogen(starch) synthase